MLDYLRNLGKSKEEKQREALNAYLDDVLAPQQRQQVERDLETDPKLKAQLDQMRIMKQQMRQLPRRQVPRNFTLDPALFGRPRREPLIQAYPVLRTATVLTAFIFIFLLGANLFLGGMSLGTGSSQPLAMEVEQPAAETAMDVAESEAAPVVEAEMQAEMVEEMVEEEADLEMADEAIEEEAAPEMEVAPAASEPQAEEKPLPAEALQAPTLEGEEMQFAPRATKELDDEERQAFTIPLETAETERAAPTQEVPEIRGTEIGQLTDSQVLPALPAGDQAEETTAVPRASDEVVLWLLVDTNFILLILGIIFIVLLILTLSTRRRL